MNRPTVLTDVRQDGAVLYAIATECYHTRTAEMIYVHAHNAGEVFRYLQDSKILPPHTRVAWIAPAVGVLAELDEKDNVTELVV